MTQSLTVRIAPKDSVAFMLKDSKRFPKTNGWGYATFTHESSSDTWKVKGEGEGEGQDFALPCHGCHTIVKDSDFVFTHYPKR